MRGIARFLSKPWTLAALAAAGTILVALHVPDPEISPALTQRQPDPANGKYVAVLGDCAACHSAPGGKALAGEALTAYLTTGYAGGHGSASGTMAEVIDDSLRYAAPENIHTIIAYLRSIRPIDNEPAIAVSAPAAIESIPFSNLGERVFAGNCSNCRDWDGKGVQPPYAALLGSRTVNDPDATNLRAMVLAGSDAPLPIEHAFMPMFARGHSNDELAAVANFVNGYFGNRTASVSAADIDKERKLLAVGNRTFFGTISGSDGR